MSSRPFRIRKPFSTSKRGRRPGDTAIGLSNSAPSISLLFLLLNLLITLLSKVSKQERTTSRDQMHIRISRIWPISLSPQFHIIIIFLDSGKDLSPLRTTNLSIVPFPCDSFTAGMVFECVCDENIEKKNATYDPHDHYWCEHNVYSNYHDSNRSSPKPRALWRQETRYEFDIAMTLSSTDILYTTQEPVFGKYTSRRPNTTGYVRYRSKVRVPCVYSSMSLILRFHPSNLLKCHLSWGKLCNSHWSFFHELSVRKWYDPKDRRSSNLSLRCFHDFCSRSCNVVIIDEEVGVVFVFRFRCLNRSIDPLQGRSWSHVLGIKSHVFSMNGVNAFVITFGVDLFVSSSS